MPAVAVLVLLGGEERTSLVDAENTSEDAANGGSVVLNQGRRSMMAHIIIINGKSTSHMGHIFNSESSVRCMSVAWEESMRGEEEEGGSLDGGWCRLKGDK